MLKKIFSYFTKEILPLLAVTIILEVLETIISSNSNKEEDWSLSKNFKMEVKNVKKNTFSYW